MASVLLPMYRAFAHPIHIDLITQIVIKTKPRHTVPATKQSQTHQRIILPGSSIGSHPSHNSSVQFRKTKMQYACCAKITRLRICERRPRGLYLSGSTSLVGARRSYHAIVTANLHCGTSFDSIKGNMQM